MPKGELICFLADVGAQPPDGDPNFVEKAKEFMELVVTKKIFMRPKDLVGIMLGGHPSENLNDQEQPCKLLQEPEIATWKMVNKISSLQQSKERFTDWYSALKHCIKQIQYHTQCFRVAPLLIMIFDCDNDVPVPHVDVEKVRQKLHTYSITPLWIGSKNLDDCPEEQLSGSEKILMEIIKERGEYKQMDESLPSLRVFKQPPTDHGAWKCPLKIGNQIAIPTATYDHARYALERPSAKKVSVASDCLPCPGSPKDLEMIRRESEFVDRHKKVHAPSDIINGYMYGRKFIPITEEDEAGMKYESGPKSFELLGFAKRSSIELEDLGGDSTRLVVPDGMENAKPFYCLAKAMVEDDSVAIIKRVYAKNFKMHIGVLSPRIDPSDDPDKPGEAACFVLNDLLYEEKKRVIQAKPLHSVMKTLSKEKEDATGDLIDSMMLNDLENELEGGEIFGPGTVPSVNLQHLWDSLTFRVKHPGQPIPPIRKDLTKLIEPPESIKLKSEPFLKKVQELFPVAQARLKKKMDLLAKETKSSDEVAPMVLNAVSKIESDLEKMETDDEDQACPGNKGVKRKKSVEESSLVGDIPDPDLEEVFADDI